MSLLPLLFFGTLLSYTAFHARDVLSKERLTSHVISIPVFLISQRCVLVLDYMWYPPLHPYTLTPLHSLFFLTANEYMLTQNPIKKAKYFKYLQSHRDIYHLQENR